MFDMIYKNDQTGSQHSQSQKRSSSLANQLILQQQSTRNQNKMDINQQPLTDNIAIIINSRQLFKHEYQISNSTIQVHSTMIDIVIEGNKNKIKMEESSGKIKIVGSDNLLDIRKTWLSCKLIGNRNIFAIQQCQFQMTEVQGQNNFVPGILGENPQNHFRRVYNMRINQLRNKHKNLKKFVPSLLKSVYNSETRQCGICYDDIKNGDEITSLFCFHFFHSTCIEACLQTTTKCPVCTLDILHHISTELRQGGSYEMKQDELIMRDSQQPK